MEILTSIASWVVLALFFTILSVLSHMGPLGLGVGFVVLIVALVVGRVRAASD